MNDKRLGMAGTVVKELIAKIPRLPDLTYHIFFDNFFTNLPLLVYLKNKGYRATGTLRKNRVADAPLTDTKRVEKHERGWHEVVTDSVNGISIVRWNDNKCVTIASTDSGVSPLQTATRFDRKSRTKKQIPMPASVSHYNYGMGGVDRFDQNLACYATHHRTKKWWWPFFRFCLDLCKYLSEIDLNQL